MKSFFSRLHDSTQTGPSKSAPKESYKFWTPSGDPERDSAQPANNDGDVAATFTSTRHHGEKRSRAPKPSHPLPVLPLENPSSTSNAAAGPSSTRKPYPSTRPNPIIPTNQYSQVYSQGPSKAQPTRYRDPNDVKPPPPPSVSRPSYSTRTYPSHDNPPKASRRGNSRNESTPAAAHEMWHPSNIPSTSKQTEERWKEPARLQEVTETLQRYHSRNEDKDLVMDAGKPQREKERPRDRDRDRVRERDRGRDKDIDRDKYRYQRQVREIDADRDQERNRERERERELAKEREREQKELQRQRELAKEAEREKERREREQRELAREAERERDRAELERQRELAREAERERERREQDRQRELAREAERERERERKEQERQREIAREAEREKERKERERELVREAEREKERKERERELVREAEREKERKERERELVREAERERERKEKERERELAREAERERDRKERERERELAKEAERARERQEREREKEIQRQRELAKEAERERERKERELQRERELAKEVEREKERNERERERELHRAREREKEQERERLAKEAEKERERQLAKDAERELERTKEREREERERDKERERHRERERERYYYERERRERDKEREREKQRLRERDQERTAREKGEDRDLDISKGSPNGKGTERPRAEDLTGGHDRQRDKAMAQISKGESRIQEQEYRKERDTRPTREAPRPRDRDRRYRAEATDGEQDLRRPKYLPSDRDKRKEANLNGWVSDNYTGEGRKSTSRAVTAAELAPQADDAESSDGSVRKRVASRAVYKRPTEEDASALKIIRSRQDKALEGIMASSAPTNHLQSKTLPETFENQNLVSSTPQRVHLLLSRDVRMNDRLPQESLDSTNLPGVVNDAKNIPVRREINRLKLQPRPDEPVSLPMVLEQSIPHSQSLAPSHSRTQSQANEHSNANEPSPIGSHRTPSRVLASNDTEMPQNTTSHTTKAAPYLPPTRQVQTFGPSNSSNVNDSKDVIDSQRSQMLPERPSNQYLTTDRMPEGPTKLEISNSRSVAISDSENRDRQIMVTNLKQRSVDSPPQQPPVLPIDVRNSSRNGSSKQQGVQIPGPHYNNVASYSVKVEYTESFPLFPSSNPKAISQVTPNSAQGDCQPARVLPITLHPTLDITSTEIRHPSPQIQKSATIAEAPFNESPNIGKLSNPSNKADARQNPYQADHLSRSLEPSIKPPQVLNSRQNLSLPIERSPTTMTNKDVSRQDLPGGTDMRNKTLSLDDRKIAFQSSNSPMRKQEPLAGTSYENPPLTPANRHLQTQLSFIIPSDNQQRTLEYQGQERVGASISRPPTRTGLQPDNLGHTLRHQVPLISTTNTYQEVTQPSPIPLTEALSNSSNKANPHKEPASGPFIGRQTTMIGDESNHVKEELMHKTGGTAEASSQPTVNISRPPTSTGFQTSALPGYNQRLTPVRTEPNPVQLSNSKQESPGRQRNVKLDSPYKQGVTIPQMPIRSQSKQDSPGIAQQNLASPITSPPTLPVVPENQRSFKSSKQESPRMQVNIQTQVMNLQAAKVAEDLVVPIAKSTSKQESPLLSGLRQVHATPRIPENALVPEQIAKSTSNVPFGNNPQVTVPRYSGPSTPKQDTGSQSNIPVSTLDSKLNQQASLVAKASHISPSSNVEDMRTQLPQDTNRDGRDADNSSTRHIHSTTIMSQPTDRNERPSPLLNARTSDASKPSPTRPSRKHDIEGLPTEADPPSLGFFTTNFGAALSKATHEKPPITPSQNQSDAPEKTNLDPDRAVAQAAKDQSIKYMPSMMKRYELQSNVTDAVNESWKPERIHSRQSSMEQYRTRKDSGDRLDPTRSFKTTTPYEHPASMKKNDEPSQSWQGSSQQPPKIQNPILADLLSSPFPPMKPAIIQNELSPLSITHEVIRQRTLSSSSNRNGIASSELIKPRGLPPENLQIESSRHVQSQRHPTELPQKWFIDHPRDVPVIQETRIPPVRPSTIQPGPQTESTPQMASQRYGYELSQKPNFEADRGVLAQETRAPHIRPSTAQPQSSSAPQREPVIGLQAQGEPYRHISSQRYVSDLPQKPSVDQTRDTPLVQETRSKAIGSSDVQQPTTSIPAREGPYVFPTEPSRHILVQRYPSESLQRPTDLSQRPPEQSRDPPIAQETRPSAFKTYSTQPMSSFSQGREASRPPDPPAPTSRALTSSNQAQTSVHPSSLQRDTAPIEQSMSGRHGANPSSSMEPTSSHDRRGTPIPQLQGNRRAAQDSSQYKPQYQYSSMDPRYANAGQVPLSQPTTSASQYAIRHQHSASLPSTFTASITANASSREDLPRSATPAQAHYKMSTLQANAAPVDRIASLPKAPSEETILLTPSSLARSMVLKPTTTRQSVTPLVASQASRKGGDFFNMFKKSTTTPIHPQQYEIWHPTAPAKTPDSSPKAMQSEPEPDARRAAPSRRAPPPPISIPVTIHGMNQKNPNSNVFTPFKYLTSKRNRAVSVASVEAQDGTAPNTVVGSPTTSMHSQVPIQPPPLRDPYLATEEWRDREEAGLQRRSKAKQRRQRPGVVFDVEEEHPNDIKRRPRRVNTKHRSSSKQTESSQPGPSQS